MKKSDLKTGMIVTIRDGSEYVVLLDAVSDYTKGACDVMLNSDEHRWNRLENYEEDLTYKNGLMDCNDGDDFDIIKVELSPHPYTFADLNYERSERKLLWKREKPVKEMTMAELEAHFGCKVKIVK